MDEVNIGDRTGTYVVPKVLEFFPRGGLAPHRVPPNKGKFV